MRDCPCFRTNRNRRGTRRTDTGAGRCEWVRGRAVPVLKQPVGLPYIFRWTVGLNFNFAGSVRMHVICAHYDTGLLVLA